MYHPSVIELSKSALKKNLRYIRTRIGKRTKFVSVIKGNAYGHGLETFVPMAESLGVNYFAVSEASEAMRVCKVKTDNTDLMIMSYIDNEEIEWAVEKDVSFYVFDFDRLEFAIETARKMEKKARIHIEVETGFNRTGFEQFELSKVADMVKNNPDCIHLEGLCTHYAGAESIANHVRVQEQIKSYSLFRDFFKIEGIKPKFHHTACSAASLNYPETIMNMVRIGIAQYGYWPTMETRIRNMLSNGNNLGADPLVRVISWKSRVMSTKRVTAGSFVSYGNSYLATKDELIAVIPIGYAHGYSRSLSNLGSVLIRGKKVPVIGMVNMNMMIVNVSSLDSVQKGDEVVLIGKQGRQEISVSSFADLSNYVNYEMLTRLPRDIPRRVVS
jgi:alanine racemase